MRLDVSYNKIKEITNLPKDICFLDIDRELAIDYYRYRQLQLFTVQQGLPAIYFKKTRMKLPYKTWSDVKTYDF